MSAAPGHRPAYAGDDGALLDVAEAVATDWAALGVRGSFLARNIDTGGQLGFDAGEFVPLASVVKVPVALVVLDLIAAGDLDAAQPVTVRPETSSVGPTGLAAFRHPATVAVGDLLQLIGPPGRPRPGHRPGDRPRGPRRVRGATALRRRLRLTHP